MISKSVQLAKEDISKEMSIFISRDMIARFERDGNDCTKSSPKVVCFKSCLRNQIVHPK